MKHHVHQRCFKIIDFDKVTANNNYSVLITSRLWVIRSMICDTGNAVNNFLYFYVDCCTVALARLHRMHVKTS